MALYSPDTMRRRRSIPFVGDDDLAVGAPPQRDTQPQSALAKLTRNVKSNAAALGNFFAGVRKVANREPGTPASQLLGERLAAGAAASRAKPGAAAVAAPSQAIAAGAPVTGPTVGGNKPAAGPVLFNPSIDQMRAGRAIPETPRRGTETGVTLPDGRKLSYGAMVNGVPTFSDGSGGFGGHAASIPRTMSDAEIAGLGDRLPTVPAGTAPAGFASPQAFNSPDSEANIASLVRSRQGGKFGITPEMNAAADLAAVTNQDARTTLGRAALNASRRANAASTTLQRKAALGDLAGLREGVIKNAALGIDNAAALDRTGATNQATLQRQALANTGALDQQALQNEGELNRTDLAGQYGIASALASARAKNTLSEKDLTSQAVNLLAKQPSMFGLTLNGQIEDPNAPGGMRAPTAQELQALMQRAKATIQAGVAPTGSTAAPYAEGTRLTGPGGKTYVVKNGVPVEAQ